MGIWTRLMSRRFSATGEGSGNVLVPGQADCEISGADLVAYSSGYSGQNSCTDCTADVVGDSLLSLDSRPLPDGYVNELDAAAIQFAMQNLQNVPECGQDPPLSELDEKYDLQEMFESYEYVEGSYLTFDCNDNGKLDLCEIRAGEACDDNLNGIPDSCETCSPRPQGDCYVVCEADGSGDGTVTIADVVAAVSQFGGPGSCDVTGPGDGEPDGVVTVGDLLVVITQFGLTCNPQSAPPLNSMVAVEEVTFPNGYIDERGDVVTDGAAEVAAMWPGFSANYTVYRVYVEVENETDSLDAVSSFDEEDLQLVIQNKAGTFYNHASGSNLPPDVSLFETHPELACDTWITLGPATNGGGGVQVIGTINLSQNVFATNVAWYKLGGATPVPGGSTGYRILIGQFAVPKGKLFGGSGLLSGEGIEEYAAFSSGQ